MRWVGTVVGLRDAGSVESGARPSGTVTFVFTDLEGSTALWEANPADMRSAVARHDDIVRDVVAGHAGYVFSTGGDSFSIAFSRGG